MSPSSVVADSRSHLADAVHFGLENNDDKSRIGPLTDAKHQKDQKLIRQCMLRAWIEISLHIYDYFFAHEINGESRMSHF